MKMHYRILLLAIAALAVAWPVRQTRAQAKALATDTLTVEWGDASGNPILNALRDAVVSDTLAGKKRKRAGRVYKLLKGGFYWNTERIENSGFTLRIVGEKPGKTALENPALLQMVARTDGTVDGRLITGKSSITLKNLWLTGRDDNNVQTYYQPIQMDANDSRFIVDNCVLERTNFALIAFTGKNNDIFFTNCKFRNLIGQPSTQQWEGRGISIWADQDTVIVENNTFFNLEFTAFQLEGGSAKYVRFNHNTIVNHGRNINTGNWFQEAYFANCLIINGFWQGEGHTDVSNTGRDARASHSGIFSIGQLPSQYGPEEGRRIVFAKMAAWLDPKFKTYYGDSIRTNYFINPVTQQDFLAKYGPSMTVQDTLWLTTRPNIKTYPDSLVSKMWKNINDLRTNVNPAQPYWFAPTAYATDVAWPLPEDFSYTTGSMKTFSTDKLPVGDLNWFPTQKATWEAGKAGFIKAIEDLAGPRVKMNVVQTLEAEAGTLGGNSAVQSMKAFTYFVMDAGGYMEWTFDLAAAATVDLKVWTNLRNQNVRGEFIKINGTNIRNNSGYGEFYWAQADGIPINEWTWKPTINKALLIEGAAALDLPKGTNTIRIEKSWGWQNFAGIDILTAGSTTVLKSLRAPDVSKYESVTPTAEGAKFTPSGFKSVQLGANGTITWNINPPTAGNFRIQVYYQNPGATQNVVIKVDGATVIPALALAGKADSTGQNVLSDKYTMTAGAHTLLLSESQVNVDQIQLVQEMGTGVNGSRMPEGYALEQNFPNPFNPVTTISFSLAKASNVKLTVYNVLGQKVASPVIGRMTAGAHAVQFDAGKLSSGIYIYRIEAGDFKMQKRMLLLK